MDNYKFIKKWSDFVLNETLKTHEINYVMSTASLFLSNLEINNGYKQVNNTIHFEIYDFFNIQHIEMLFDALNSIFIDQNGWFPSSCILTNLNDMKNKFKYDEEFLIRKQHTLKDVLIIYEPKYDLEINIPKKLYHLSIQEYNDKILKNGLCPKNKNKKSVHLDRIYVCDNPTDCVKLIPHMKLEYEIIKDKNNKNKINSSWIIYEIDSSNLNIKLYKDPNYIGGYYITDNINPKLITIYSKE